MDTKIVFSYHRILVVEKEGTPYLGIQLMGSQKARELSIFAGLKKEHGWIISGDRLEPWPITGFLEVEGKVCFYGPFQKGVLLSSLLDNPNIEHLPYLQRLAAALTVLTERRFELEKLYSNGIFFLDDGRVLFFPWKVMKEVDRIQEMEYHLRCYEQVNHPEKRGEENLSFSLAVMLYRTVTGKFPFTGTSDEDIHGQIRERTILSPKFENPDLRGEISDTIMENLGRQEGVPLPLKGWNEELQKWLKAGVTEPVSDEERDQLKTEALRQEEKNEKKHQRRNYFFKNRLKLLIIALSAAFVIWIGSGILKNILAPPATLGKSPQEVVFMFYESIDGLDSETLEDCLDRKVDLPELKEILNLYVISRVRTAYEGNSGLINAADWIASGKPPLNSGQFVYGITSLKVLKEKEGVFRAAYEKWITVGGEGDQMAPALPIVEGTFHEERLFLKNTGKVWKIEAIEILTEQKILN